MGCVQQHVCVAEGPRVGEHGFSSSVLDVQHRHTACGHELHLVVPQSLCATPCVAWPGSSPTTSACWRISPSPNFFLCSIEMNMSYIYHAIYNYFSRDNVALPGLAKYFLDESHAEREHAQMLMDFQVRLLDPIRTAMSRSVLRWMMYRCF